MGLEVWLNQMVQQKASDLFITVAVPPTIKIDGQLVALSGEKLTAEQTKEIIFELLNDEQKKAFLKEKEFNFAIQKHDLGRFRVNVFQQRSAFGAVLRRIESVIPTLEALGIPQILGDFSLIQRGLVLIVGATGSGKSSTLAAMIGNRNHKTKGHIVSIEDPIEFIHKHDNCIVTQREVGIDTDSFEVALKNTLRQAPDVILIGEIRSLETIRYALSFAETGHLCLATLHASNANQALDRIASFFSKDMLRQLWMDLSLNLKAIVAQQLVPLKSGEGRVPAVEILINTPIIEEHIRKGEINELKELITKSSELGMQTFDQSLIQLYIEGKISYESALKYADSENEVRLQIKLLPGGSGINVPEGLSMVKDQDEDPK
jgi:twitching motility protein PilU